MKLKAGVNAPAFLCHELPISVTISFDENRLRFANHSPKRENFRSCTAVQLRLSVNVLCVRNLLQKPFLIRHAAVLLFTLRVWLGLHLLLFRHWNNGFQNSPVLPFLQMFAHVVKGFNNLPLTTSLSSAFWESNLLIFK